MTKRVLLGVPGYGGPTPGASRAMWRASAGPRADVPIELTVTHNPFGSLLAQNFNALWCGVLNAELEGNPFDYFAMLHSDCEAEDGWLDRLISELQDKRLDVLSAVVAIKDPTGCTSTALDRLASDPQFPWRPLCRLTLHEIFRLPETFTSEDVGYRLLVNTGCWVCRCGPWMKEVRFTVRDRIAFDEDTNTYRADVQPEDWDFSRQCHALGLRVGATRKVKVDHCGPALFSNQRPWGERQFDQTYVTESLIPADGPQTWFPHEVDGWLTFGEGEALSELARDKHVLEIGSYCGRSTICLARHAKTVHAVDTWDGRGTPRPRLTREEFDRNLAKRNVSNVTTSDADADLPRLGRGYDLAFIDGAHDYDSVRHDIAKVSRVLRPGGLIAFHDYRRSPGECDGRWDAGVTQAVNEMIVSGGGELLARHGTVAVVRPVFVEALTGAQAQTQTSNLVEV